MAADDRLFPFSSAAGKWRRDRVFKIEKTFRSILVPDYWRFPSASGKTRERCCRQPCSSPESVLHAQRLRRSKQKATRPVGRTAIQVRAAIGEKRREQHGLPPLYKCWTLRDPNPESNPARIANPANPCSQVSTFGNWHHRSAKPSWLRTRHCHDVAHRGRYRPQRPLGLLRCCADSSCV